jgi:outer membrane immunogenic protein
MKKALASVAAIAALWVTPVLAADMPLKAPPPPAPVANWTGCYLSAGFGYGLLDDKRSVSNPTFPPSTSAGEGWLGAFGGGCDYQFNAGGPFGPIVIGAFGEYDPMDITGNSGDPSNASQSGTQTMRDAWYAGARAGVLVMPTLLAYIDGGWTGAHISPITYSSFDTLPAANPSGWFLGGGYEYALPFLHINGLFWKTEYRFSSYDNYDQNYIHPTFIGTRVVHNSVDVQTITSSLVWRFNWLGH